MSASSSAVEMKDFLAAVRGGGVEVVFSLVLTWLISGRRPSCCELSHAAFVVFLEVLMATWSLFLPKGLESLMTSMSP